MCIRDSWYNLSMNSTVKQVLSLLIIIIISKKNLKRQTCNIKGRGKSTIHQFVKRIMQRVLKKVVMPSKRPGSDIIMPSCTWVSISHLKKKCFFHNVCFFTHWQFYFFYLKFMARKKQKTFLSFYRRNLAKSWQWMVEEFILWMMKWPVSFRRAAYSCKQKGQTISPLINLTF